MQESKHWSNTTRYFVLILVLGGLIWLAISARDLIGPLAISALLAYVLNPLVIRVSKQSRLSRQWAVLLVFMLYQLPCYWESQAALIAPADSGTDFQLGRAIGDDHRSGPDLAGDA